MKLPNWFRFSWWVVLVLILTAVVWLRRTDLLAGKATPFDALAFVVWVCMLLVPIFSEISLFGLKFRQEFEGLRNHIDQQALSLRSEIHNAVDFRPQVNPQFNFASSLSDSQLPSLEGRIRPIIEETLKALGAQRQEPSAGGVEVPPDVAFLLSTRYGIERELRRIWREAFGTEAERRSATRLLPALVDAGVLPSRLGDAIRGIHSVCSPATHGEEVSDAKVRFVRDLAPDLLSTLRAIHIPAETPSNQPGGERVSSS